MIQLVKSNAIIPKNNNGIICMFSAPWQRWMEGGWRNYVWLHVVCLPSTRACVWSSKSRTFTLTILHLAKWVLLSAQIHALYMPDKLQICLHKDIKTSFKLIALWNRCICFWLREGRWVLKKYFHNFINCLVT